METAADLITIVDESGKFIFVNHASERIYGLKPEKCIGLLAFDFIHPDDIEETKTEFQRWLVLPGNNFSIENRQVHKNGTARHMLWNIHFNRDKKGNVIDITSIARDITERKRIEYELLLAKNLAEQNEVRLKIAQEASKAGAWEWNMIENTFYWPNEILKIFGFSPDDEFGFDTWRKAVHPDDVEMADKRVELAIQNKTDLVSDYRIIKPDKGIRWIRAFGRTFYDGDKPIRMVGMCIDITEQKQNEEARIEHEEKFKTTVQNIPGMIYRANADGNFDLILNSGIVCGYQPDDFLSGAVNWNALILDEDRDTVLIEVGIISKSKNSIVQEYKILAKDSSVRYVKDYKTSRYVGSKFVGVDGIVFDNTQSKLLEEDLKLAKHKAEESDRLKTAFLANMSHEIRTPMNGILGFTDLLTDHNLEEERRTYYANIVKSSSQQLLNIISDIIDISKIEAEEFTLSETTFPLTEFLNEIIEQSKVVLKQKKKAHIKLYTDCVSDSVWLTTDRNRLSQILLNLVTNAIKFTHIGQIRIGCSEYTDTYAKFFVEDTGIGIDKSMHEVIFERFRQVNDESFESGTGIGLSICKALVQKLGGEIYVESKLNEGSKFYFTIKQGSPANSNTKSEDKTEFNLQNRKAKILIAEDEEINYLYLKEILKTGEFELIHAENGEMAVDMFRKNAPDMVLMDIKMPIMDGYEALREIQKINSKVPVIAITAYAMSNDEKGAIDAGFKAYLSKPVAKEKIWTIINQYIKREF